MITKIFLTLTDYPVFRRLLWKPIYEWLAKRFSVQDWSLMNYGYTPNADEALLVLNPEDEINRYPIQLYHYLATKTDIGNRKVLEVGSGRGGGAAYLKKYLKPEQMVGVDIASNAVKIANKYFGKEGITFMQGSAEQLPFENESFDVVINVESSHTYGSVPIFLSEVKRVLRKGGYFLCADIRTAAGMKEFTRQIQSCGLQVVSEENISENVSRAITLEDPVKQKRIAENIPGYLQDVFKQFAGTKGSKAQLKLQNGELLYHRFVLRK